MAWSRASLTRVPNGRSSTWASPAPWNGSPEPHQSAPNQSTGTAKRRPTTRARSSGSWRQDQSAARPRKGQASGRSSASNVRTTRVRRPRPSRWLCTARRARAASAGALWPSATSRRKRGPPSGLSRSPAAAIRPATVPGEAPGQAEGEGDGEQAEGAGQHQPEGRGQASEGGEHGGGGDRQGLPGRATGGVQVEVQDLATPDQPRPRVEGQTRSGPPARRRPARRSRRPPRDRCGDAPRRLPSSPGFRRSR